MTPTKNRNFILLIAFCLHCCIGHETPLDTKPPLYLGMVYDVSGSVAQAGLPMLTNSHIERLIAIFNKRGGTLAFGLIDEQAYQPLLRLELKPVVGRLDERARLNMRNREAISNFASVVKAKISEPRNAQQTDLNGALARLVLFFGEPNIPQEAEKVALVISDGIDTVPSRRASVRLPEDVQVLSVGIDAGVAQKLFGKALRFESIEAVVTYFETTINK